LRGPGPVGGRGTAPLVQHGSLAAAASTMIDAKRVAIMTGFPCNITERGEHPTPKPLAFRSLRCHWCRRHLTPGPWMLGCSVLLLGLVAGTVRFCGTPQVSHGRSSSAVLAAHSICERL
jgi:hypothetical protein